MKGSDRQAAKARAINTAIRGRAENLEQYDLARDVGTGLRFSGTRFAIRSTNVLVSIARIVNPRMNRMNAHVVVVQGSIRAEKYAGTTEGDMWRARVYFLQASNVFR